MRSFFGKTLVFKAACLLCVIFIFAAGGFAQDLGRRYDQRESLIRTTAPIVARRLRAKFDVKGRRADGRLPMKEENTGSSSLRREPIRQGVSKKVSAPRANRSCYRCRHKRSALIFARSGKCQAEQTVYIGGDDAPVVDTTRTIVGGNRYRTRNRRTSQQYAQRARSGFDARRNFRGSAFQPKILPTPERESASQAGRAGEFFAFRRRVLFEQITIDVWTTTMTASARDRFRRRVESIAEFRSSESIFRRIRARFWRANKSSHQGRDNTFRGRAFMFFRDDNLNANTWYNNSRGIARLPLTEYNPGFTLGGPVVFPWLYNGKNRTFFSIAYEYTKVLDTTLIDTYIPVVPNPRFDLPPPNGSGQFCDNASPAACTATPPTAGYVSPYTALLNTPNVNHILGARIDHKLFNGTT